MNSRILGFVAGVIALAAPLSAEAAPFISNPGRFNGGRVSVQTQTGTSCSATAPDRASLGVAAGVDGNDSDSGYYGSENRAGFAGGVFIAVPFGGQPVGDCNLILEMEQQRARLDMAVTLFEAGAMTSEELKEIAEDVKQYVR